MSAFARTAGVVDLLDEAHELVDVLQQRLVERLQLEHDLEALRACVLACLAHRVPGQSQIASRGKTSPSQ